MKKLYTIIISGVLSLLSLNSIAEMNNSNFFEDNFDSYRMQLSDTYRYLISKNSLTEFIKSNSTLKRDSAIDSKYLNKNYSQLCSDIYYGKDELIENKREGEICLKFATLQGYNEAPFLMASILYVNQDIKESIKWLGLSAGMGYRVENTPLYQSLLKTKDFEKIYREALINSLNFPLDNYSNQLEIINNYYINDEISDSRIFDPDNDFYHLYNFFQDFDYKNFVEYKSERTEDASELIMLSHINNKDWISFIKYCNKYIDNNIYLKQYCLKSIYKNTGESKSLLRYALNEYNFYSENRINKDTHFENFYFALGLGKEQNNKYLNLIMNDYFNDIEKIENFKTATVAFNNARKYFYSTRNIK
tara:strand:+ start:29273 stop:30358 length:1086 start_codon:yes stop_codon:yes gene_type:complete